MESKTRHSRKGFSAINRETVLTLFLFCLTSTNKVTANSQSNCDQANSIFALDVQLIQQSDQFKTCTFNNDTNACSVPDVADVADSCQNDYTDVVNKLQNYYSSAANGPKCLFDNNNVCYSGYCSCFTQTHVAQVTNLQNQYILNYTCAFNSNDGSCIVPQEICTTNVCNKYLTALNDTAIYYNSLFSAECQISYKSYNCPYNLPDCAANCTAFESNRTSLQTLFSGQPGGYGCILSNTDYGKCTAAKNVPTTYDGVIGCNQTVCNDYTTQLNSLIQTSDCLNQTFTGTCDNTRTCTADTCKEYTTLVNAVGRKFGCCSQATCNQYQNLVNSLAESFNSQDYGVNIVANATGGGYQAECGAGRMGWSLGIGLVLMFVGKFLV